MRKSLLSRLAKLTHRKGAFSFTPEADAWYRRWYITRPSAHADKQYAGYYERKPDHMIRLAMILWVAEHDEKELVLDVADLQRAERVLTWLEAWLPSTFDEMTSTAAGEDQSRILRQLRQAGGSMEHSNLLRRNSSKMNAEQFKRAIATLKEAKLVEWDAVSKTYFLTSEGWT
jgi:hypothetical protein